MAIGRISGQLLKANLVRDGVDLAFETDLLYLNVTDSRIGVNTSTPSADLDVNGTTQTVNLRVDNQAELGNIVIENNTITSANNAIYFTAAAGNPTVYHSKLIVDDFEISGNKISTTVSNSSLEIDPSGTGTIELKTTTNITGDLTVSGSVSATGDIVIGGNIVIGDELTDTVTINASISSDLIPETDNTYRLGNSTFRWNEAYVNNFYTTTINVPELNLGNITVRDETISVPPGYDLRLEGNSSGGVVLGNFKFNSNSITNVQINAITQIVQSGTGYFKISGTNGFVPPVGGDIQRPSSYAVVGMTRYNTDSKALEIWDGFDWASPAGASGAVSENDANEISTLYALTLG